MLHNEFREPMYWIVCCSVLWPIEHFDSVCSLTKISNTGVFLCLYCSYNNDLVTTISLYQRALYGNHASTQCTLVAYQCQFSLQNNETCNHIYICNSKDVCHYFKHLLVFIRAYSRWEMMVLSMINPLVSWWCVRSELLFSRGPCV